MSVDTMMRLGVAAETAKAIAGGTKGTLTAAGSAIGDAAAILADTTIVTASGADGVQLPDKYGVFIVAMDGGAGLVYPHSASGIINGGSAGAAKTIADGDGGIFIRVDALNWIQVGAAT